MREFLERHTDLAIFLILFLEDLGIPMPIPADVVVMYAGFRLREATLNPYIALPLMLLAVNLAATTLYFIVRRGGRPLVDRFGHYLHLDAQRLTKAEAWLERRGAVGIYLGRVLPGVRLATVVVCGLFKTPLRIFLPAQFLGVTTYLVIFLLLGYAFGPQAAEFIRLPAISIRLVLLVMFAVAVPLILRRLNRSTADDDTGQIAAGLTRGERTTAALIAGFVGMIELVTIWGIATSLTNLMGRDEIRRAALTLVRWINAADQPRAIAIGYTLDYLVVLIVCLIAALLFFEGLMPGLHLRQRRLGRQTLLLWSFMLAIAGLWIGVTLLLHVFRRPGTVSVWLSHSGGLVLSVIVVGLLGYAYVAVETRRLVIDQFSDDPELAPSVNESISHESSPAAAAPPIDAPPLKALD